MFLLGRQAVWGRRTSWAAFPSRTRILRLLGASREKAKKNKLGFSDQMTAGEQRLGGAEKVLLSGKSFPAL
ncbi:hypothetical protein NXF25_006234 [Crotalus adamanteus]|uniref:Uncharacterized protein n=1 Tax=Crotalus adamanteus TaxID=8729 RepID=A0AAW1C1F2_CROAD